MAVRAVPATEFRSNMAFRKLKGHIFEATGLLAILAGLGMLLILVVDVLIRGVPWLDWQFLTTFDSRFAERAGARAAIYGTVYMMFFTMLISLPLGVMTAVFLEEFAPDNWFRSFIQINLANLAGVPSIIYGLLGLQIFVRYFALERSVLAGSLTMALLILPIIVVASQEAVRAVPSGIRDASLALGATRSQTVWHHVLPYSIPGIMTGNILAASRAIGETAPLITIGALTFVPFTPNSPLDRFTVLPIQIYNWTSKPQAEFHELAAAGILILLVVLVSMNSIAIVLRQRLRKQF
jgi:phosphate transport system permease protein